MYERTIAYIDYFENDIKVKNIGFMKWESDGINHQLQIKISGLYKSDTMEVAIKDGLNKILSYVAIEAGQGELKETYRGQVIGVEDVSLSEIEYLILRISSKKYGIIRWNRKKNYRDVQKEKDNFVEESIVTRNLKEKEILDSKQKKLKQELEKRDRLQDNLDNKSYEEQLKDNNLRQSRNSDSYLEEQNIPLQKPLYDNKWQQLCHTYQVIHPFKQKEDYLSITPEDFIIFREPYQKLVHNSFLIHGYYNYRHIILGKMMKNHQEIYYLGVPGVYYEREKMAAEVFGFEGFESVEEEIANGAFGYYLRKVEL
ncbi:MAG: DUF6128 domain-containing protein [Eubacteriales bacterium]